MRPHCSSLKLATIRPPSVQRYIMLDQLGVSATVLVALGMYGRMYS